MKEVTERRVLEEMLLIYGSIHRLLSEGLRNEVPADGLDAAFYALQKRAEVVRRMMRNNESEKSKSGRTGTMSVLRRNSFGDNGNEVSVLAGEHDAASRSLESYLQGTGMYPVQDGTEILQEPEGSRGSMEQEERRE